MSSPVASVTPPAGTTQLTPGPTPPYGVVLSARAGHVQAMWLEDRTTGERLIINPSAGGIWLNDFDLGYPAIRDVIYNMPNAHGTNDQTQFYANRAITLALTCVDAADTDGTQWPAATWADLAKGWLVLGRSLRLVWQMRGMNPRQCNVRVATVAAPVTGSDVDRFRQLITIGLLAPNPFLYERPLAGLTTDPSRSDFYYYPPTGTGAGSAAGSDFNFNGASGIHFPISFGGGTASSPATASIPATLVGTIATKPFVTVFGACTQPRVSISDPISGVRAKLEFTATISGNHLSLSSTDILTIDVAAKTAIVTHVDTTTTDVYRYLAVPPDWDTFLIQPWLANQFNFYPVTSSAGSTAYISLRRGFI